MHQSFDAGSQTRFGQQRGQLHMGFVKLRFAAMQDGNQINHRIMSGQQGGQLRGVVYIGLNHRHHGQHLHRTRWQATCGHCGVNACAVQSLAHMATHKTAST